MLIGTGLTFRSTGARSYTIEAVPRTDDGAIALSAVRVESAGERPAPKTSVIGVLSV